MAAMLLTYLTPEDSLLVLVQMIYKQEMIGYFRRGMPALFDSFYCLQKLMEKYLPKLHNHFMEIMFIPQMYASQWFMTVFVVDFPHEVAVRIWDIFLIEGRKIIYRIALAIFMILEKDLLGAEM
jgi:hypothetical protein